MKPDSILEPGMTETSSTAPKVVDLQNDEATFVFNTNFIVYYIEPVSPPMAVDAESTTKEGNEVLLRNPKDSLKKRF